jgi:hypothetical protein
MADAPRLLFYWGPQEDASILSMRREDWHTTVGMLRGPLQLPGGDPRMTTELL